MNTEPPSICPVCNNQELQSTEAIVLGDRRKGLPGTWKLRQCSHCGVISQTPIPTDVQLAEYYVTYSKDEDVDLSPTAGSRSPILRALYHRLTGDVDPRDFVDVPGGARVLDYGCGHAGYLSDFHRRGTAISGAEIAGYVVDACRRQGFDVRQVDNFSHIPFDDGEFDIVYLMQVFEHLREPHVFMQELARVLKSGGSLYLAVPNANSIWRKVFGKNWVSGWFAPFHLFHYSRASLANLSLRHGFELVDSWSRTPESWFRLNLKACLHPNEKHLDWHRSLLDQHLIRHIVMLLLRIIELPCHERDCLVMELRKR